MHRPGCGSSVETCWGLATSTAAVVSLLLIGWLLRAVDFNKLGDLRQLAQITLAIQAHHGSPFQEQTQLPERSVGSRRLEKPGTEPADVNMRRDAEECLRRGDLSHRKRITRM